MRLKNNHILPKVLMTLVNAAIAFGAPGTRTSRGAYQAFRRFDKLQKITDAQLRQTVRYAVGKKYISITQNDRGISITLLKEGKKLAGEFAIRELRPAIPPQWDEKWRIVMFDIPEEFKKERDGFARDIKRIGFAKIQKSVFAFPHPCFEELQVLMDFHGVRRFVTLVVAETLEHSRSLEKTFRLSRKSRKT